MSENACPTPGHCEINPCTGRCKLKLGIPNVKADPTYPKPPAPPVPPAAASNEETRSTMNGHTEYEFARDDARFLRSLAAPLSYNVGAEQGTTKHRLTEIAMRLETKFYVPKERDDPIPLAQPRTNPIPQPTLNAPGLLEAAAKHMRDRAATYDQPQGERSMGRTVAAFNVITGRNLSESDGWLLMALLKMVRSESREAPHEDSVTDLIAYAALFGEARLGGQ